MYIFFWGGGDSSRIPRVHLTVLVIHPLYYIYLLLNFYCDSHQKGISGKDRAEMKFLS